MIYLQITETFYHIRTFLHSLCQKHLEEVGCNGFQRKPRDRDAPTKASFPPSEVHEGKASDDNQGYTDQGQGVWRLAENEET